MINEHCNARSRKTVENVWWIQTLSWLDFRLQMIWIWLVQIGSSMGAFKSQILSLIYLIIPTNWNTIHSYPTKSARLLDPRRKESAIFWQLQNIQKATAMNSTGKACNFIKKWRVIYLVRDFNLSSLNRYDQAKEI